MRLGEYVVSSASSSAFTICYCRRLYTIHVRLLSCYPYPILFHLSCFKTMKLLVATLHSAV